MAGLTYGTATGTIAPGGVPAKGRVLFTPNDANVQTTLNLAGGVPSATLDATGSFVVQLPACDASLWGTNTNWEYIVSFDLDNNYLKGIQIDLIVLTGQSTSINSSTAGALIGAEATLQETSTYSGLLAQTTMAELSAQNVIPSARDRSALICAYAGLVNNNWLKIVTLGDSKCEGAGVSARTQTWPTVLGSMLRNQLITPGSGDQGPGYLPAASYIEPPAYSDIANMQMNDGGVGLNYRDVHVTSGQSVTWNNVNCTGLDAYFGLSGFWNGTADIYVDGSKVGTFNGSKTTLGVNAAGNMQLGGYVVPITGLSSGTHTIRITGVSGTVACGGIFPYTSKSGISVWGAGHSGSRADVWNQSLSSSGNTLSPAWCDTLQAVNPDLVIIGLGWNDENGNWGTPISPSDFGNNALQMVKNVKTFAPNAGVIWCMTEDGSGADFGYTSPEECKQYNAQFVAALETALKPLDKVSIVYENNFYPGAWDNKNPVFLTDGIHPNVLGNQLYASYLAGYLGDVLFSQGFSAVAQSVGTSQSNAQNAQTAAQNAQSAAQAAQTSASAAQTSAANMQTANDTTTSQAVKSGSNTQSALTTFGNGLWVQKSNNLSDLASATTARTNLGLATVAASGKYSDLAGIPSTFPPASASVTPAVMAPGAFRAGSVVLSTNYTVTASAAQVGNLTYSLTPTANGVVKIAGYLDVNFGSTANHIMYLYTNGTSQAQQALSSNNAANSRESLNRTWYINVTAGTTYTFAIYVAGATSSTCYATHSTLGYEYYPGATA